MTTQRKNINNEQFFTNFDTAKRLASWIQKQDWFDSVTKVCEPSAGDGAWLKAMHVHEAYDIAPQHPDVKLQDFLSDEFAVQNDGKLLFVGNPPFGRMGKLAKQFINKCAETGDYIAFILPASFAKVTQIRQIPKNFHLIHQEDLLDETFRFERDGKVVSTIFQVWEKRQEKRVDPQKKTSHEHFSFLRNGEVTYRNVTSKIIALGINTVFKPKIEAILKESLSQRPAAVPDGADVAICTHGSGVGKVYTSNFKSKSSRTHRFIKIESDEISVKEMAKRLRSLDYDSITKYTVGATCVSTEEIVSLYSAKHGG